MAYASIVLNPRKALMFIMYMDLIIKSMKYYVQIVMQSIMEMMKFLTTDHLILFAKIVVRLVPGKKLRIDGGLLIQMGKFIFVST